MLRAPLSKVDYVVVGAGASGMAFVDTLLTHHRDRDRLRVAIVDKRKAPGGHWNDDYPFVKLHQPATNYGVESEPLEKGVADPEQLASRAEILNYYDRIMQSWIKEGRAEFFGGATFDFETRVARRAEDSVKLEAGALVDARYTENDLPCKVAPRWAFDGEKVRVVTPNELATAPAEGKFVVVGCGKTAQDAILHLQLKKGVPPSHIAWIVPNDFWITARDAPNGQRMDTCTEFLSAAFTRAKVKAQGDVQAKGGVQDAQFMQDAFLELEKLGKVYRFDPNVMPTKFKNATLNRAEVEVIAKVERVLRKGRLSSVEDDGTMRFEDGSSEDLSWPLAETSFVHCSAGAFNFSSSLGERRPKIFERDRITIQGFFEYPGFPFNGSLIAKLECDDTLDIDQKNEQCELPSAATDDPGFASAGTVTGLHPGHGLVVSMRNLKRWYDHGLGPWLHQNRLFHLTMNGFNEKDGLGMVEENLRGLGQCETKQMAG